LGLGINDRPFQKSAIDVASQGNNSVRPEYTILRLARNLEWIRSLLR